VLVVVVRTSVAAPPLCVCVCVLVVVVRTAVAAPPVSVCVCVFWLLLLGLLL
jgi:hypothetical protein